MYSRYCDTESIGHKEFVCQGAYQYVTYAARISKIYADRGELQAYAILPK